MALPVTPSTTAIYYPDTDGLPVAESDFQLGPLIYAIDALRVYFQGRDGVYVAGDLFLYYEEGNPSAVAAPDVFVVLGAPNRLRSSYMLWREPKAPDFVLEITSQSTRAQDQGTKRECYALLGVQEYFLYDPTPDYLEPPLQGLCLVGNAYQPLPATTSPEGALVLRSDVLGLELRLEEEGGTLSCAPSAVADAGNGRPLSYSLRSPSAHAVAGKTLRLYDPTTGQRLLSYQETEQARREAEARARATEARVAELEARLQALQEIPPATPPPSADLQS
jgi:Uma2 family endonuclease